MAFVAAKCPACGGDLQLDNTMEKGFCMYCGSQVIVQQAIGMVHIDNTHMLDKWMHMAEAAYDANNCEEAYTYYTKVVETQPNNWKAVFFKGMSAAWQSSIAKPRIQEAISGVEQAIAIIENDNSMLSQDEKDQIRIDFAGHLDNVIEAYNSLAIDSYNDYAVINDLVAGYLDIYYTAYEVSFNCIGYGQTALNVYPLRENIEPNETQVSIMKHICSYIKFICEDYNYYLDFSKETLCFGGMSVSEKQKYLDLYDEMTYHIRKRDAGFAKNEFSAISRIDPPTVMGAHNMARTGINKSLQLQVDEQLEERKRKEAADKQNKYWDEHPDEYREYLENKKIEEEKKAAEAAEREQKRANKRIEIKTELRNQQRIVDANKSIFGESARKRKAAQSRINDLKKQLENI